MVPVDVLVDALFGGAARVPPRRRTLRRHEFLMRQGDPSSHVYLVADGGLILTHDREDGSYVAADWAGPDGVYGLEDAVAGQPYTWSGRATTRSEVLCLPTEGLWRALLTDLPVALAVARYLSRRVRYFAEHAELLALARLTDRVKRTLRMLADRHGPSPSPISLPFTQGDLAALVGASRQRVNHVLGALHRTGIIGLRGGTIRIVAPTGLWQEDESRR